MNIPIHSSGRVHTDKAVRAVAWTLVDGEDHPAGICIVVGAEDSKRKTEVIIALDDLMDALQLEASVSVAVKLR